jgi:hypothetical protein
MGTSTNAILGWGVAFEKEWEAEYADDTDEEFDACEYTRAEAALKPFGVELRYHCSNEFSKPCLFIDGTVTVAHRGYPQAVSTPEPGADWAERIDRAVEALRKAVPSFAALKVPPKGWYMVSYWG